MFETREEAEKVLNYYQSALKDWELNVVFEIKNDTIQGAVPNQESKYYIHCRKGEKIIDIEDACKDYGLIKPYQLLRQI